MKRGSAEKKGSHLCGVAKFKPSGESHGDFFEVKKKTSPESYFSPSFSISLFPLYPSKNAKILSIVTYVTPGLERDYHHSIAFIVLHFLRVLYLAPFLMTLSQREKGKRDIQVCTRQTHKNTFHRYVRERERKLRVQMRERERLSSANAC